MSTPISSFTYSILLIQLLLASVASAQNTVNFPQIGHLDRFDSSLDRLIAKDAVIEVLCGGFEWAEGPVWVPEQGNKFGGFVLFSDIPHNAVMKWQEGVGVSVFLKPSGYTGVADYGREPGSNGLALDPSGRLVLCEHGDRRVSVLTKGGGKLTLADRWNGKRFNSPNDLAIRRNGDVFFTDPIYGLPQRADDPLREIDFCGVYRLQSDGAVTLQYKEISRPNGIAFSPDEKILYVANSDGNDPVWRAFPVQEDGNLGSPSSFFDSSKDDRISRGGGDGLKVDVQGNVFATGPGGVLVLSPHGKLLGRIVTGERIANVGWGNDGSVLYLTSDMYLCRIQTLTKGDGFD
ncbi:MAG TPA: gluconolactonase [Planctomycetaceae bacterium]|nr:gluconolactonase [Planctomycetaceae bacterium]|tara:strand:- start:2954 stop:3997 length:1044 start_codon:yes stop_codon:yes gene_type:complete